MKLRVLDEVLQWWCRGAWVETQWDDWAHELKCRGAVQVFLDMAGECLSGSELIWEEVGKIDALLAGLSASGLRVESVVSAQSLLALVSDESVGWIYSLGSLNRCCIYEKGRGLQSFVYKNEAQKDTYLQQVGLGESSLNCAIKSIDMQALIVESNGQEMGAQYHSMEWGRVRKRQRWDSVQSGLALFLMVGIVSVWVGAWVLQSKEVGTYKKIPSGVKENLRESQSELDHRKQYEEFLQRPSLPMMAECWMALSQNLQKHPNLELNFIHLNAQRWRLKGQVKGFEQYAQAEQALNAWLRSMPDDVFKVKKEVRYETSQILAFEVEFDGDGFGRDHWVCLADVERDSNEI